MHSNWRNKKAWESFALPLSSPSDEACKMFDATVTQYVGWYDDDSVGGIEGSLSKMMSADQNFVMGHVLKNGLELLGTGCNPKLDPELKADLDLMITLAEKSPVCDWERKHVQAMHQWSKGNMKKASLVWEDILTEKPTDVLALKFAHDTYFYLGCLPDMRDSVARVLPQWKKSMPLYSYLYGMLAFGQEETNLFTEAEKSALKALSLNKRDAWATHAFSHVNEMLGRQKQGSDFLEKTETDWASCGMLACHNYWHWAVYHIERGNYEDAIGIYENAIYPRFTKSGAMLDIVDAVSLLYRLEFEGISCSDKWKEAFEICQPHKDDHILSFNDAHIMMTCMGSNNQEEAQIFLQSLQNFINNGEGDNRNISENVGKAICEAIFAYKNGDFELAVDLLMSIRYQIVTIGGSNAQRDVFNLLLINAALKSPLQKYQQLARGLLYARKCFKENAPMTDRLMARALGNHVD